MEGQVPSKRPWRVPGEMLLLALVLAVFCVQGEFLLFADGGERYETLLSFVSDGRLTTSRYSMIGPIFAAPLVYLGASSGTGPTLALRYNLILFTLFCAAAFGLMRRLPTGVSSRFLLLLFFGSQFPFHLLHFYGEVFTCLGVALGSLMVTLGRGELYYWGWFITAVAVANVPACAGGLVLLVLVYATNTRRWSPFLALPLAAGLILFEGWLRRGGATVTGYEQDCGLSTIMPYSGYPGFSYPLFFGALSVLFCYGKGLMWFCPGLFLPLFDGRLLRAPEGPVPSEPPLEFPAPLGEASEPPPEETPVEPPATPAQPPAPEASPGEASLAGLQLCLRMWLAYTLGLLLVYGKWWGWYGGVFWGPRYFLFASLPASLALAMRLSRPSSGSARALDLVALLLSLWVGFNGIAYGIKGQEIAFQQHYRCPYDLELIAWYVPEFSVLWYPFVQGAQMVADGITGHGFMALLWLVALIRLARPVVAEVTRWGEGLLSEWSASVLHKRWRW